MREKAGLFVMILEVGDRSCGLPEKRNILKVAKGSLAGNWVPKFNLGTSQKRGNPSGKHLRVDLEKLQP